MIAQPLVAVGGSGKRATTALAVCKHFEKCPRSRRGTSACCDRGGLLTRHGKPRPIACGKVFRRGLATGAVRLQQGGAKSVWLDERVLGFAS